MPDNTPDSSGHNPSVRQPIPVIESNELGRNIERLLDNAIAVPYAEVSLYVHHMRGDQFASVNWEELFGSWCAEARASDEDVSWHHATVDVQGCAAHEVYTVTRQEQFRSRTLCTVYVFKAAA